MRPHLCYALLVRFALCASAAGTPVPQVTEAEPALRIERLEVQLDGGRKLVRFPDLAVFDPAASGESSSVLLDAFLHGDRVWMESTDRRNLIRVGQGSDEALAALAQGLEEWDLHELEAAASAADIDVEEDFRGYWSPLDFGLVPGLVFAVRDDSGLDDGIGALVRVGECDPSSKVALSVTRGPACLFTGGRIEVACGSFERARATLERAARAAPTRVGPALWLASIGGSTEPLAALAEDADWYAAMARELRGEMDDMALRMMALRDSDDDAHGLRRWSEILLSDALAQHAAGCAWGARGTLLSCLKQASDLPCGQWSREFLERASAARRPLPALPAPRVDGFLGTLELLRSTADDVRFFREFVDEHFAEDPFDGFEVRGRPVPDLDRGRNDYFGELLFFTRKNEPTWEMLRDSYLNRGLETPADEPVRCVQAWVVLREFWQVLGNPDESSERKCAIVRNLPLLEQVDAWYLAARAADAAGADERVAAALVDVVGQKNFAGWGDAPFLELLFTEERAPDLIEAYLRLPGRISEESSLGRFLVAHRTEPRFTQPAIRLLPSSAVGVFRVSEEEARELTAALERAALPERARVGLSYPWAWDSSGSLCLEVRCRPSDLEATWERVRSALVPALGQEDLEQRVYRSGQADNRW